MSGQRMLLGPASYSDQTLLSSSSTIIWKERQRGEKKHKTSEVLQSASRMASRNFQLLVNVIILKTLFFSSSQQLSGCFLTGNDNVDTAVATHYQTEYFVHGNISWIMNCISGKEPPCSGETQEVSSGYQEQQLKARRVSITPRTAF